jgi:ribosome-binding factor A
MAGRGGRSRGGSRPSGGGRGYPRTERLNELLREIVAEELAEQDDDELAMVTITGVDVDRELEKARVYYSCLDGDEQGEARLDALEAFRPVAKRAISAQARLRRTPELVFVADQAVRSAQRIEDVLRANPPRDVEIDEDLYVHAAPDADVDSDDDRDASPGADGSEAASR